MSPEEEQNLLDDSFSDEVCDDCGEGAEAHAVGVGPSGKPFIDCTND